SYDDLDEPPTRDAETDAMIRRIVISVDQFTSYRGFTWCPLGSLHRRLRAFFSRVVFLHAGGWVLGLGKATPQEYDNPQSNYKTKGISLNMASPLVQEMLQERDNFILALLHLYEQRLPINFQTLARDLNLTDSALELWLSIMQAENVLNPVPGKTPLYSLFRTHYTVNLVA